MKKTQFAFASTPKGLTQRAELAASLLSVGRTVRLFREECVGFELLMLEAGPRAGEGQIATSMKVRTHADDDIEDFNNGRR